jgi:uncharacterized membrane protein YraQ (UPF0718 family)
MTSLPDPAVGAVVAALIAALASLLGLVISKEHKTSEFRQAWIDSLRSEISSLVAHIWVIFNAAHANYESRPARFEALREDFLGVNQATATIRLRLNPNEKENKAILKSIEQIETLINTGDFSADVLQNSERQLITDSQVLLKREWLRVRSGELFFRILKILLVAVILAGVIFLILRSDLSRASPAVQGTLHDKSVQSPRT